MQDVPLVTEELQNWFFQVRPGAIELCIYRKNVGFWNVLHAKNTLIERSFKPELEWHSAL
jgi:hypothetical protein